MAGSFGFSAYKGNGKRAFISYKKVDESRVKRYAKKLHDKGINLWYDQLGEDGLKLGQIWEEIISENISLSSVVIAFVSKNMFDNPGYMKTELEMAFKNKMPLIIVLIDEIAQVPVSFLSLWTKIQQYQNIQLNSTNEDEQISIIADAVKRCFDNDTRDVAAMADQIEKIRKQREKTMPVMEIYDEAVKKAKNKKDLIFGGIAAGVIIIAMIAVAASNGISYKHEQTSNNNTTNAYTEYENDNVDDYYEVPTGTESEALKRARELMNSGDYDGAAAVIDANGGAFASVENEMLMDEINVKRMLKEIRKYEDRGDIGGAIEYIEMDEYGVNDDWELEEKYMELIGKLKKDAIQQAKVAFENEGYEAAITILTDARYYLGGEDEELEAAIESYQAYAPTSLFDLPRLSGTVFKGSKKDNFGNEYGNAFFMNVSDVYDTIVYEGKRYDECEYYTNGKYSEFSGLLAPYCEKGHNFTVVILADDKEIGKYNFSYDTEPIEFKLNIKGAKKIGLLSTHRYTEYIIFSDFVVTR